MPHGPCMWTRTAYCGMATGHDGQIFKIDWDGNVLGATGNGPGRGEGRCCLPSQPRRWRASRIAASRSSSGANPSLESASARKCNGMSIASEHPTLQDLSSQPVSSESLARHMRHYRRATYFPMVFMAVRRLEPSLGGILKAYLWRQQLPPSLDDLARMLPGFCLRHSIARVEVFGSVARDQTREGSDLDLMVTFRPGVRPGTGVLRHAGGIGADPRVSGGFADPAFG